MFSLPFLVCVTIAFPCVCYHCLSVCSHCLSSWCRWRADGGGGALRRGIRCGPSSVGGGAGHRRPLPFGRLSPPFTAALRRLVQPPCCHFVLSPCCHRAATLCRHLHGVTKRYQVLQGGKNKCFTAVCRMLSPRPCKGSDGRGEHARAARQG